MTAENSETPDSAAPADNASEQGAANDQALATASVSTDEIQASLHPGPTKLALKVEIGKTGDCERHITVEVPREDIDRYFAKVVDDLLPKAAVPGFRAGRAPRKLVERRFRKDVEEQVRGSLLIDSLSQVSADYNLAAISEPDLDVQSVQIPDTGPLTFEFDIEVRPEFELPEWKGLKIARPMREFTAEDVESRLRDVLKAQGTLVPSENPAQHGDYVVVNATVTHNGETLNTRNEETIPLLSLLSFPDGTLGDFDKLLAGAKSGDKRTGKLRISAESAAETLRDQEVEVTFEVLEVKKLEVPAQAINTLREQSGLDSEEALRTAIKESLERRLSYEQQQRARQQILAALVSKADWKLPRELLKKQARRELDRAVLELQRSGFSEDEIQAREARIRQNVLASTARALKEHFVLERLAEELKVEADETDYNLETMLIANQLQQNPRRVRAQLEKANQMDALRNQIIERKVLQAIQREAQFTDEPYEWQSMNTATVSWPVSGVETPVSAEDAAE